jgi:hypothetical protein
MLSALLQACLFASTLPVAIGDPAPGAAMEGLPTTFIQNVGQRPEDVRFEARNGELTAFFTDDSVVLDLGGEAAVSLRFEDVSPTASLVGEEALDAKVRYYRGADASRWTPEAPAFLGLRYRGLRPGMDVVVLERGGRLAYDLHFEAGADPSTLAIACDGVDSLELRAPDRLVLHTSSGPLEQTLPAAWEVDADGREHPVQAAFRLLDETRFSFSVPDRTTGRALVIDPGLDYGSYLGGALLDVPAAVTVAPDGDLIVVGTTGSPNFPNSVGAYQPNRAGINDAYVARIDPTDGSLVFATFFGGTDTSTFDPEGARDVALVSNGAIFVVGRADSGDFPVTPGTVGANAPSGTNGFVARFSGNGALAWSTAIGGSLQDEVTSVTVDALGRPTIAGVTFSNDFPATPGAYDESFNSIFFTNDLFVARLASNGGSFDYATYVGGSLRDEAEAVQLAADGSAIVVGTTGSADFPATPGAYDDSFNGLTPSDTDAFALRLDPTGSDLQWASFLGGLGIVEGLGGAVDDDDSVVLVGKTQSDDYPASPDAAQPSFGGGPSDAFASRLSADGSTLSWSTFLGGSGADEARCVQLGGGLPTLAGATDSVDFPTERGAIIPRVGDGSGRPNLLAGGVSSSGASSAPSDFGQPPKPFPPALDDTLSGGVDGFVTRLGAGGRQLLYSSYHGGSGDDIVESVALDAFDAAVLAGQTTSLDLPTPGQAYDTTPNGAGDTFLARFSLPPFENLGAALASADGSGPRLVPHGRLQVGQAFSLALSGVAPHAPVTLVIARHAGAEPFHGGTLVAHPIEQIVRSRASIAGELAFEVDRWPSDLPSGACLVVQAWAAEPGAPGGLVASNAVALLAP